MDAAPPGGEAVNPEGRAQAVPFGKWVWCACPAFETVTCGVAQIARGPEYRRMVSASDRRSLAAFRRPDTGGLSGGSGFIRHGLGLALTIRETPRAKAIKRQTPSPHPQGGPPQARFHPRPGCRPALAGTRGKDFSGGWLGRSARQNVPQGHPFEADPAASGTRRCTASSIVPPHVTADTRRPSSRLDRHVDDPSGDGSATMMARGWRLWMKWR
jgi:hypothetical protein